MERQQSVFITEAMVERLRRNAQTDPWCADATRRLIERAAPWHTRSDTELWDLMFGPTVPRGGSGMIVFCPVCKTTTAHWKVDVHLRPWKVACPHCDERFPKNDFHAYYRSGLDVHGVFDSQLADRRLLVNTEHPDPADPLHRFGVDDGAGYCEGKYRWPFAAMYLMSLWKQEVIAGIEALSTAYVLTGDGSYAHQAAILLDRVADLHPLFDFAVQVRQDSDGYVDVWHGANGDVLGMAFAYDRIRPALPGDTVLAAFLSEQARRYRLDNPKKNWADIRRNIEDRIFRDALLVHPERVHSNYPRGEILRMVLTEVLGEPGSDQVLAEMLDVMAERASRVDGVTGEKGLSSYCMYTIAALAEYLALLSRRDPALLPSLLQRHPGLRQTYRFHADTFCLQRYHPNIGDAASFGMPVTHHGMFCSKAPGLAPSGFSFMRELYRATGDPVYLQMLHFANRNEMIEAASGPDALRKLNIKTLDDGGLPYDLFADDPAAFRRDVQRVLAQAGTEITVGSVNKEQWAVAILRSGTGDHARALWLDYDIGGAHAHADGMNLGLYALGLDLLPDYGYPQIRLKSREKQGWFSRTAAHNTVVVDGRDQGLYYKPPAKGHTTLWADGTVLRAARAEFGAQPDPLPPLCGRGEDGVALYAYRVGRFHAVRVWTRADDAADWTLAFSDDFQRAELGPDWKVLEGEWRIESGWLVGKGKLRCTRRFPGRQRLDYEAQAGSDQPCDLSAFLSCSTYDEVFFGFGSNNNQGSKLLVRPGLPVGAESDRHIIPGKIHRVSCRCEPARLQMWLDGSLALDCAHVPNIALQQVFGDDHAPKQFERTAMLVDVSLADAYVVDVFRVVGGRDHARFFHSTFGTATTKGLSLKPSEGLDKDFVLAGAALTGWTFLPVEGSGGDAIFRNIQTDPHPPVGWSATWTIEDHHHLLPADSEVHLRHTDLTRGAAACVAESWINSNRDVSDEMWIPTLVTRRRGAAPLATTFVAVIEPFTRTPFIASIRRLNLVTPEGVTGPDSVVAVEVTLVDGRRDLIIATDTGNPLNWSVGQILIQPEWNVTTDGELVLVRRDSQGRTQHMALTKGTILKAGSDRVSHANGKTFTEKQFAT